MSTKKPHLHCAFCGKGSGQVTMLIAGPPCPLGQAHICNECVSLCTCILFEKLAEPKKVRRRKPPAPSGKPDVSKA